VLFEEGRTALERGDHETACSKFAESQRLDPAAGTLMNLATCEEHRGLHASAWQHWKEAIDQLAPGDDRVTFAQKRADALKGRLPYLTIRVAAGTPAGTRVERDGIALGGASIGVPLPVDPGEHRIVVVAPGHARRTFTVSMTEAEKKAVEVAPGAVLPASEPPPVPAARAGSSPLGWVIGGVGVLGVGAGVVTGLMVAERQRIVDDECVDRVCTERGVEAADEGRTLLIANAASWGVGIVGLGVGTYLLLSSGGESYPQRSAAFRSVPGGGSITYTEAF
jgi:hypothetical protein